MRILFTTYRQLQYGKIKCRNISGHLLIPPNTVDKPTGFTENGFRMFDFYQNYNTFFAGAMIDFFYIESF